jgi:hypothetical protein
LGADHEGCVVAKGDYSLESGVKNSLSRLVRSSLPWLAAGVCLTTMLVIPEKHTPSQQNAETNEQSKKEEVPINPTLYNERKTAIEKIADQAQKIIDTELLVVGGSIAILLGTGYHRPQSRRVRLSYSLFLLAWVAFSASMYWGYDVRAIYLAYLLSPPRSMNQLGDRMELINTSSIKQAWFLYVGLGIFACWLVFYLIWWIFTESIKTEKK